MVYQKINWGRRKTEVVKREAVLLNLFQRRKKCSCFRQMLGAPQAREAADSLLRSVEKTHKQKQK